MTSNGVFPFGTLEVCLKVEVVAAGFFSISNIVERRISHTIGVMLQYVAACKEWRSHVNAKVHSSSELDNHVFQSLVSERAMLLAEGFRKMQ